jgi:tRNA (guanosine-2'-O-)-methyltransferase
MTDLQRQQLLKEHLSQFVSEHKRDFMERVLAARTRYVTMVLEDIYQSQNTSAVIRTCECMGIQDVHVIETNSSWSTNKLVLKGSNKWLNIIRYRQKGLNNTAECFDTLRSRGYRVAVTDPAGGVPIGEVPLDRPLAIVMGNERHGSSPYALQHADLAVTIPMAGFTESMNISVSAAICLHTTLSRLRQSDEPWRLSDAEKEELRLQWYRKSVRNADVIEREFLRLNA